MSKVKLSEKINWGNNIISSVNELDKRGLIEYEKEGNKYFAILKDTNKLVEISEIAYLSKVDKDGIKNIKRKTYKEINYFAYTPFDRPRYNTWGDLIS